MIACFNVVQWTSAAFMPFGLVFSFPEIKFPLPDMAGENFFADILTLMATSADFLFRLLCLFRRDPCRR
jgi:hypothetical protein